MKYAIIITMVIWALSAYLKFRNVWTLKYRLWFNDKCYQYCMKRMDKGEFVKYPDMDEIIGTYAHTLLSILPFEKTIVDKKRYREILEYVDGEEVARR
jgi:hypothetical protein